jgi:hypothetical protein
MCKTFGRAERMRVPSPAASTIARQVRAFIATSAALSYPSRQVFESRDRKPRLQLPANAAGTPLNRSTAQPMVRIC